MRQDKKYEYLSGNGPHKNIKYSKKLNLVIYHLEKHLKNKQVVHSLY